MSWPSTRGLAGPVSHLTVLHGPIELYRQLHGQCTDLTGPTSPVFLADKRSPALNDRNLSRL